MFALEKVNGRKHAWMSCTYACIHACMHVWNNNCSQLRSNNQPRWVHSAFFWSSKINQSNVLTIEHKWGKSCRRRFGTNKFINLFWYYSSGENTYAPISPTSIYEVLYPFPFPSLPSALLFIQILPSEMVETVTCSQQFLYPV